MVTVELVYDGDCPNVAQARAQLLRAFERVNLRPRWQEWRCDDPASPAHVRGYGSPTILVDGVDVARAGQEGAAHCRVYRQPDGSMRGIPSVDMIATALTCRQTMNADSRPLVRDGRRPTSPTVRGITDDK